MRDSFSFPHSIFSMYPFPSVSPSLSFYLPFSISFSFSFFLFLLTSGKKKFLLVVNVQHYIWTKKCSRKWKNLLWKFIEPDPWLSCHMITNDIVTSILLSVCIQFSTSSEWFSDYKLEFMHSLSERHSHKLMKWKQIKLGSLDRLDIKTGKPTTFNWNQPSKCIFSVSHVILCLNTEFGSESLALNYGKRSKCFIWSPTL